MDSPKRTTTLKPGRDGLGFFKETLGTELDGWAFEQLLIRGTTLELSLIKRGERATFELAQPHRDRSGRTSARTLAVYPRGSREGPKPHEQPLAEAILDRFSSTSFAGLLRRLRADALHYSDPSHPDVPSRLDRHHRVVDHSADWWKFFYPNARYLEQDLRLQGKVVRISHGTAECRLNNPQMPIRSLRYFADDQGVREVDDAEFIDTSLTEADVLAGHTMTRLSEAFDRAASLQPQVVHLMTTCLPELIGDDPRPLLRRIEQEGHAAVCWSSKTRDPAQSFDQLISRKLQELSLGKVRDPNAVILAGIPSVQAAQEAASLLAELGLKVVGELFPKIALRESDQQPGASAVVWLNPVGWEKLSNDPFLNAGLAVVRYHPPFGCAGTQLWLQRVCEVLGRDSSCLRGIEAKHQQAFGTLRAQCVTRRIALVGDRADLEVLVSRGRSMGMSVASVLCDLGFRVACFVYDPCPVAALRQPPRATGAGSLEFVPFSTAQQLDELLACDVDAAFTHFSHDPRLEAFGIPGFCEDTFEPGYLGMVRTGNRILHKMQTRAFPRQVLSKSSEAYHEL